MANSSTPAAPSTQGAVVTPERTYSILRPLGEGGMGRVLLVTDPERPEPVALKLLQVSLISETRVTAFKREFSLLADLHHPHVCRVYDFGYAASHNQYFFTAEHIEGEDLYRAMRQSPLDALERVIVQILSALDCIHSAGLVHFDVKGANILVSRAAGQPQAVLVDFGVTSPMHQPLTEIGGTLRYMAPELLWPNPPIEPRIDLYSLGVVCYRLFTGIYPNEVQTVDEARAWHAHEQPDFAALRRKGLPEYLCQFTKRLLATNPNDRFSSAAVALNFLTLHSGHKYTELPLIERTQLAEGPLVGREGILATLTNALDRVTQRERSRLSDTEEHPQVYLIAGPRGYGKSRLLKEFKHVAQLKECTTWLLDAEWEASIIPERLPSAVTQPTCYLIDNLDRATPEAQRVAGELAGLLYAGQLAHRAPPIVLVGTYAPEAGPPLKGPGIPTLELAPLSRAEVEHYIAQLVGSHPDQRQFTEAVWNFSRGVPLPMAEAARRCAEAPGKIPSTIEELYREQIRGLDPLARQYLEVLAMLDRQVSEATLAQFVGSIDPKALKHLIVTGLVRRLPDEDQLIPATGALTQTIVAELAPARRQALADRVVEWLQQAPTFRASDAAPYAAALSNHGQAIRLLEQAASEAEARGEGERALGLLVQLLDRLEAGIPDAKSLGVRRRIATLRLYQGQYQACEEMLHQITARRGAPELEDLKLLGLVKRAQRRPAEARAFYDRALATLPADPSDPTYLYLCNERSQTFLEEGAVQQAADLYQQTHAATRKLSAQKRGLVPNNNLGMALARLGKYDEAVRFYQEKLSQFGAQQRLASSIHGQLGAVHLQAGHTDAALAAFTRAWELAMATGDHHSALPLLENMVTLLQKKGAYSTALGHAERSLQLRAAGAPEVDVARSLLTVATLYLNLGLLDLAARYLIQAMRLARRCGKYSLLGWTHITFGYLHKEWGRLMEALNDFEETIAIGESRQDSHLIRWGCYGAVDLMLDNGELEEALPYLQQLDVKMTGDADQEFQMRHALLTEKLAVMKQPHPEEAIEAALEKLTDQCATNSWQDLLWEIEHLRGVYHHKRDETEAALLHLRRSQEIIETMAANLSEEYRTSFLAIRSRARVQADLDTLTRAHQRAAAVTSGKTATSVTGPHEPGK